MNKFYVKEGLTPLLYYAASQLHNMSDYVEMYLAKEVDEREAQHIAIDRAQKARIAELETALRGAAEFLNDKRFGTYDMEEPGFYEDHEKARDTVNSVLMER